MTDALATIRADVAEYLEIRSVCHDAIESYAPPDQVTELMRQANDVADRIIGATIAGMAPSGEPAERLYLDDEPRPGSWFGDTGADGRMLTQRETDILIRCEIWKHAMRDVSNLTASPKISEALGDHSMIELMTESTKRRASHQRGGIDSDPLVRLLAFRVWLDRDRSWFEDHGVRQGDPIVLTEPITGLLSDPNRAVLTIGRSWHERPMGHALEDGRPGQMIKARIETDALRPSPIAGPGFTVLTRGVIEVMCRVSDRPRQQPDWFRPGDENPLSSSAWRGVRADRAVYDEIAMMASVRVARYRREIEAAIEVGGSEQDIAHHIALHTPLTHDDAAELLRDYRSFHERQPDAQALILAEQQIYRAQYNQAPQAPTSRPGARNPGAERKPPVPPWARQRGKR